MGGSVKDQLGRIQDDMGACPAVILVNPQLGENIGYFLKSIEQNASRL